MECLLSLVTYILKTLDCIYSMLSGCLFNYKYNFYFGLLMYDLSLYIINLSIPNNVRSKQLIHFHWQMKCLFFKSNFSESPGIFHIVANSIYLDFSEECWSWGYQAILNRHTKCLQPYFLVLWVSTDLRSTAFNTAVRDNYFIYQNSISIVTSSLGRFKSSH